MIKFSDPDAQGRGFIQYAHWDDSFRVTVAGAENLRIVSTGYVQMAGAADVRLTLGSQGTAGNNDANWVRGNSTSLSYNAASANHIWEIGGNEKMRIDSSGRVGIGISPAGKLHVDGLTGSVATILEGNGNGDQVPLWFRVKANNGNVTNHGIFGNAGSAGADNTIHIGPSASSGLTIGSSGQIGTSGANYGSDGQVLTSTGTGSAPAWEDAGGGAAYIAWSIQTTTPRAALSGDQIICNHASTAITVNLPASPSAGDTVIIKNVGAALVTVGRSSQKIDGADEDATMPTGNAAQLVYVDTPIGWTVL
jgi:hypothetical protein